VSVPYLNCGVFIMKLKILIAFIIVWGAVQIFSINTGSAMEIINPDNKPAPKDTPKSKIIGWLDKNKDGINDKFQDANGDGVNDVTKEKYDNRIKFVDKNKDKTNDIFIDKDGDGVNDLEIKFVDNDKDGINDNVIDYNKDGINDITGLKYEKKDLMGYRYGIVEEEIKKTQKKFIDENGDGMHDPTAQRRRFRDDDGDGVNDKFVDNDGDGVCDGRRFGHRMGMRHGQQGGKGGQQRRQRQGGKK